MTTLPSPTKPHAQPTYQCDATRLAQPHSVLLDLAAMIRSKGIDNWKAVNRVPFMGTFCCDPSPRRVRTSWNRCSATAEEGVQWKWKETYVLAELLLLCLFLRKLAAGCSACIPYWVNLSKVWRVPTAMEPVGSAQCFRTDSVVRPPCHRFREEITRLWFLLLICFHFFSTFNMSILAFFHSLHGNLGAAERRNQQMEEEQNRLKWENKDLRTRLTCAETLRRQNGATTCRGPAWKPEGCCKQQDGF